MKTTSIINKKSIWLTLGIMAAIMIGFTNNAKAADIKLNCCSVDTISEEKVEKNDLKMAIEFIENEILMDQHFGHLSNASYNFVDKSNKVIFSKTYEFMKENEDKELNNLLKNSELIMKDGDDHYYLFTGSQVK
ncbi:hypothetical protein [Mangrovivirga cuniculi]|uniref:Uncharacterized protein n=1 Tax=Mangrovivirga cuniculi TaxID=2715131 RepID=A0A4D7JMI6_9BACT|nr:hypothetical protein [Mangrovivirga cuniculi]QCK16073.1 hypothetical protein DCC35_15655 [Mangrovivirga cuniculi]